MAKRLSAWNQYVKDADREPVEIPLDRDNVVTVKMPTSGAIRRLNRAQRVGDEEEALNALLGEDQAKAVWAVAENAPPGALQALIADVLDEFGLNTSAGERNASSTN